MYVCVCVCVCVCVERELPDSSVAKESTCNAGDPSSFPGSGRWRRNRLPTPVLLGFPGGSAGKESTCNVGDLGSIPGLGRSPGDGEDYPLQYSDLENPMDCRVHVVAKRQTRLSNFHFQREKERKQFIIRNWHLRF